MDDIEFLYEGNNPMLQTLLGAASNQWDISQSDLIENMLKIGFHESAGTFDPSIQQIGGGPGVGMYQYEKGLNQGAHTAVNRLISINNLDNNITLWNKEDGQPGWVNDLINNNYDVGQLTAEQQHLLFLADKLQDPTASFKGIDTDEKLAVEWADEHQAGTKPGTPEREAILNKFLKDIPEFDKYLNKLPLEIMIP